MMQRIIHTPTQLPVVAWLTAGPKKLVAMVNPHCGEKR